MHHVPNSRSLATLVLAATIGACSDQPEPDAYGNFEAVEVVVSAEESGRLLRLAVEEGAQIATGAVVGAIDTTPLALERDQARAQRDAIAARTVEADRQTAVL